MRKKRSRSFLAAAIMPALIVDAMAAPRAVKPLVTVSDAADLVMAELIHEHRNKLPGLLLSNDPDPYLPSFWGISVDWDEGINGGPNGYGHYEYFAVDKMTGDVWLGTSCTAYHSPELARAQRQLRRRLRMSGQDYKRLRRDGPYCGCSEPPVLGPCP